MTLVYDTSTTSKRSLYPPEHADKWVVDAEGSTLTLSHSIYPMDDWCSALGAQTLGYGALYGAFFPAASLPWQIEQTFADEFCKAMDVEAVRFFKTGSDAVSCAVRLARAYTQKSNIVVFRECYHGTGDWFGQALWTKEGIPPHWGNLIIAPFGAEWFYPNNVAAVVLEPVPKSTLLPPPEWLEFIRGWCDEHGALLISDEVILGYRSALQGFLVSKGTRADLRCYGKAMGQGAAISAVCGSHDILRLLKDTVHFSGTNNGEPTALYIAQQTLQKYVAEDVCGQLANKGALLRYMLGEAGFETRGLDSRFEVVFQDPDERMSATRALWNAGILFPGFCSISLAHKRNQMERLVEELVKWRE